MAHIAATVAKLVRAGLNLVFPPACAGCQALGWNFCPTCAQDVAPMPPTICVRCGRALDRATHRCARCRAGALDALITVRSAALFRAPLRAAIHAFKYTGQQELAVPLSRYLVTVFAQEPWTRLHRAIDAVVPVPLHATRVAERGYNQAELLAHAFCQQVGLHHAPTCIRRVRFTRPQVGLDVAARQANVAAAFVATEPIQGQTILLLDDVCTTGATLQACAQAARRAGARQVYGLTLAAAAGIHADHTQPRPAP